MVTDGTPVVVSLAKELSMSEPWLRATKVIIEASPVPLYQSLLDTDETIAGAFLGRTVIIVGGFLYAAMAQGPVWERVMRCVTEAKKVLVFVDDYQHGLPSQVIRVLKDKECVALTHLPDLMLACRRVKRHSIYRRMHLLPVNQAAFEPIPLIEKTWPGLLYYGSFREKRLPQFAEYLGYRSHPCPYTVWLSASNSAHRKFDAMHIAGRRLEKLTLPRGLLPFTHSIYMRDAQPHGWRDLPANRWWECLSAGVTVLIDTAAKPSFDEAGLDVEEFLVSSREEVALKMADPRLFGIQQTRFKHHDWRADLIDQLRLVLKEELS